MFRYRRLDGALDMTFGRGAANFLVDQPAAVAQAVLTRLNLWQGEWWLDLTEGTPWLQQILGKPRGPGSPDAAIRERILGTPYVTHITDYASTYEASTRRWLVSCKVFTTFGQVITTGATAGLAMTPSGAVVFAFTGGGPAALLTTGNMRLESAPRRLMAPR
jgi:hypothetical protein